MMDLKVEGSPFLLNYLHNPLIESYIFPCVVTGITVFRGVFNSGGASSICKKKGIYSVAL